MKLFTKFYQRGVTLFELLLVLFVAAFVAVAVATIYNRVNTTYKENVLFNDMQEMAGNIRSLYSSSTTGYTGLSNSVVLSAGIAPPSMVTTSGTTSSETNAFGGSWNVAVSGSTPTQFTIELTNLPYSACLSVGSKAFGVAQSVSTTPGGTVLSAVSDVISACSQGNTNTMTLTYS